MVDSLPPKRLYRFRSASTDHFSDELEEAVDHHKVWCHPVDQQNDPFEALPSFDESPKEELETFLSDLRKYHGTDVSLSGQNWRTLLENHSIPITPKFKKLSKDVMWQAGLTVESFLGAREDIKIAAFCENANSLLLWAHYADAHTGIRLEYEWEQNANRSYHTAKLMPVIYSNARPRLSTLDACKYLASHRLDIEAIVPHSFSNNILEKSVLTKSNDWSYEDEWRFISTDDRAPGYRIVLPLKVVSISCGVEASIETVSTCLNVANEANRDVAVYKCELSQEDYEIQYTRIN